MKFLDLTLPSPQENLALDEALLDWAEEIAPPVEFLRLWEAPQPLVVLGRSSRVDQEVDRPTCEEKSIPILRRSSGGAAVVVGPGCLMYAVVLSYELRPELKDIGRAHAFVLRSLAKELSAELANVTCAGTSDLVLIDNSPATARKFSGNSIRAKRSHVLYHGTLLYDFDLSLIGTCLKLPLRQPNYRRARSHGDFVTNLPIGEIAIRKAVLRAFPLSEEVTDWPQERVAHLVSERFSQDGWNLSYPL